MACGSMVEGRKAAGEDKGQGAACTCSTPVGVSHVTQEWDPPPDAGGGLEATGVGFTA